MSENEKNLSAVNAGASAGQNNQNEKKKKTGVRRPAARTSPKPAQEGAQQAAKPQRRPAPRRRPAQQTAQNGQPAQETAQQAVKPQRRSAPRRRPAQQTAQNGQPAQENAQQAVKPQRRSVPRRRPAQQAAQEKAQQTVKPQHRPAPAQAENKMVHAGEKNTQQTSAAPVAVPHRQQRFVKTAQFKTAEPNARRRIVAPMLQEEKPMISQTLRLVGKRPASMRSEASARAARGALRMIPLGGMCEIGKNMTAYEYGNDIIIVDCGQIFPDETMPGVDAVIPDFTYVLKNRDRVRGIFVTHGHEDHIGGLPYLLREFKVPVYAGRMTIELLRYKLDDKIPGLGKSTELHVVEAGQIIRTGAFSVEFIHVNHSIADAFMFAIRTPVGTIVHSGDFKIDYTPINGEIMDLQRIAEIGSEGVLLFVCESTNIEVPGFSKSERHVGESMAEMFEGAKGRIFVATFSSNTSRLQQIFSAAERHGRKVALVGRSMLNVFNAANNLGYIQMKPDTLIDVTQVDSLPPEQVVVISTGSQGEPMSALTRIAFNNHRELEIQPGDTVIISSTPIPGNEKPIYKVINELYRRGATVYYSALADVHVSGHASQEEIKLVHSLIRPKFFVPAHGETRMLYQHAELAHKLGVPFENIFILANGDIFEIANGTARVTGFCGGEAVLIDGNTSGEADNTVLRERKLLSDDGVVSVVLAVSRSTGALMGEPQVSAMGFLYESEHEKIEAGCRQNLANMVTRLQGQNRRIREAVDSGQMASQLRSFLYERTKRRPVILINLIEIG